MGIHMAGGSAVEANSAPRLGQMVADVGNGAKFDHKKEQAIAALLSIERGGGGPRGRNRNGSGTPLRADGTRLPSDGQVMRLHGNRVENPTE